MIPFLKKYKYPIIIVALLLWILIFAQYDIITVWKQKTELNEIKNKKKYLEAEVLKIQKEKERLANDPKEIEKQSRERYFMKKDHEDVFIYDTLEVNNK